MVVLFNNIERKILPFLLLLSFLGPLGTAIGQNNFESKEELKEKAEELFEEKKFIEAKPLYSQLLSLEPRDPTYNYKFGTCLIFGDPDKEKPLKHLKYASKKSQVNEKVHYYLGLAYHLNYQFADALKEYKEFKSKGDRGDIKDLPVDQKIRMCNNGKDLMESPNEIVVLDKTRTGREEFFRYYELEGVSGRILVAPKDILHREDKQRESRSVMFYPTESNTIYYGSYGKKGDSGKDIFKVKQLPNGKWAEPQRLKGRVNTKYDEDFPFMLPGSKDLYFCSKGHNSMGGYDIFKSEFDPSTNTYGKPKNLDFPINSPDDDIFYIADEKNSIAYFASGRSSDGAHYHVYKVRLERIPMQMAILKGTFQNKIEPGANAASIEVLNANTNKKQGLYNTSGNDGDYLVTVPKSGKYKFIVQLQGSNVAHTGIVDVPKLKQLRPLKQTLILKEEKGRETLVIKNKFDEEFEDPGSIITQVMKDKAKLNVNNSEAMMAKLEAAKKNSSSDTASSKPRDLSNEDIINMAFEDATQLQNKADDLQENVASAFKVAEMKKEEADEHSQKAESLLKEAEEAEEEPEKRETLLKKAKKEQRLANRRTKEAKTAYQLGETLQEKADKKQKEADLARQYAKDLEEAIKSSSYEEAVEKLSTQKKKLERIKKEQEESEENALASSHEKAKELEEKADNALKKAQALREKEDSIQGEIRSTERRIELADENEKKELKDTLKSQKGALEKMEKRSDLAFQEAEELQEQADALNSETQLMEDLMAGNLEAGTTASEDWDPNRKNSLKSELQELEQKGDREEEIDSLVAQASVSSSSADKTGTSEYQKALENTDPSYSQDIQRIEEKDIPPEEKARQKAERKEQFLNKVRDEIAQKEAKAEGTEDPEEKEDLQKEIEELRSVAEEQEKERQELLAKADTEDKTGTSKAETNGRTTESSKEDRDALISEVDPSFSSDVQAIEDKDLSEPEKSKQKAERQEEFLENLRNEIAQKETDVEETEDPQEKEELQNELEKLRKIEDEHEKEKQELLAKADQEEKAGTSDEGSFEISTADENEVVTQVDPSYSSDMDEIESKELSGSEKAQQKAERKEEFLENLKNEIAQTETELEETNDPEREEELQGQLDQLKRVERKHEKEREELIASAEKAGNDETTASEKVAQENDAEKTSQQEEGQEPSDDRPSLSREKESKAVAEADPSYSSELDSIDRTETPEPLKAQFKAERTEELVDNLDEEIQNKRTELQNSSDPDKIKELSQEISDLRTVRKTKEKEAEKYRRIASEETVEEETQASASVEENRTRVSPEDIDPGHQSDISRIENDPSLTEKEKAQRKAEKKDELIIQLNDRLQQLREKREQDLPQDEEEAIKDSIQAMESLLVESEGEYEDLIAKARSSEEETTEKAGTSSSSEVVNNVDPDYSSDLITIEEQTSDPEEEYAQKAERNQDLLAKLDEEIQETSTELEETSSLSNERKEELKKELAALRSLREEKEVQQKNFKAHSGDKTSRKAERKILPAIVDDDYEKDVKAIEESGLSENQKKKSKIDRNKDLLQRVEKAIQQERDLADESSDQKVAEKAEQRIESLKELKTNKERENQELRAKISTEEQEGSEEVERIVRSATVENQYELSSKEKEEIDNDPGKKEYLTAKAREKALKKEARDKKQKANEYESRAQRKRDSLKVLQKEIDQAQGSQKKTLQEEARVIRRDAVVLNSKADSLEQLSENLTRKAEEEEQKAKDELDRMEGQGQEEVLAIAEGTGRSRTSEKSAEEGDRSPERGSGDEAGTEVKSDERTTTDDSGTGEEVTTTENEEASQEEGRSTELDPAPEDQEILSSDLTIEERITEDMYAEVETSPYSEENPIPMNKELPEGVIFQVQVGAFRTEIPQDHFQGFAPVIGNTGDDGITRYRVGLFKGFEKADQAKEVIQDAGFGDAFVVAFEDGERIPVADAIGKTTGEQLAGTTGSQGDEEETQETSGESQERIGSGRNVEAMKGLFFTVQVGVYSDPVTGGPLSNISQLFVKRTSTGNYRYSTGMYPSVEAARGREQEVKNNGVPDAFITAYYDGERITVGNAQQLLEENGTSILHKDLGGSSEPSTSTETEEDAQTEDSGDQDKEQEEENTTTEEEPKDEDLTPSDITFKVDLGTYKDRVPKKVAKAILRMADQRIDRKEAPNGGTNYRTKSYSTLEEANKILGKFVEYDVQRAKIIAFAKGERIELEKAKMIVE